MGEVEAKHLGWLREALLEAQAGLSEGGIPIGSVLVDPKNGSVVSRGRNLRVQSGDPTAHAEVVAVRNAGRRRDWSKLVLVSTLSPCIMCSGTALLNKIPEIVVGENVNFKQPVAEELVRSQGVKVHLIQSQECIQLMQEFIRDHPDLWNEDIATFQED